MNDNYNHYISIGSKPYVILSNKRAEEDYAYDFAQSTLKKNLEIFTKMY